MNKGGGGGGKLGTPGTLVSCRHCLLPHLYLHSDFLFVLFLPLLQHEPQWWFRASPAVIRSISSPSLSISPVISAKSFAIFPISSLVIGVSAYSSSAFKTRAGTRAGGCAMSMIEYPRGRVAVSDVGGGSCSTAWVIVGVLAERAACA